jgi:hypothetical protein
MMVGIVRLSGEVNKTNQVKECNETLVASFALKLAGEIRNLKGGSNPLSLVPIYRLMLLYTHGRRTALVTLSV